MNELDTSLISWDPENIADFISEKCLVESGCFNSERIFECISKGFIKQSMAFVQVVDK